MCFTRKAALTALAALILVQGTNGGVNSEQIALLGTGENTDRNISSLVSALDKQKLHYSNLSKSYSTVLISEESDDQLSSPESGKRHVTKDLRRLKGLEQTFSCSKTVLTGISLRGYTFGKKISPDAYRFQLKEGKSGRVIREGFLSIEKGRVSATARADFPPLFNREKRKLILSVFSSFPIASFPFFLETGKKERDRGGSLFIEGKKRYGSLVYFLHGTESLKIKHGKRLCSLECKEALKLKFRFFLFKHSKRLILYDSVKRKILYTTDFSTQGVPHARALNEAVIRLKEYLKGNKGGCPKIDSISSGQKDITISWTSPGAEKRFRIYRSPALSGDYRMIHQVSGFMFRDSSVERGRKYWYRIQALSDGYSGEMSFPSDGYAAPLEVKGKSLYAILDKKNERREKFYTSSEEKTARKHLQFLEQYHLNSLKMTLVIFLSRGYLKSGKIYVFNDFNTIVVDRAGKTFYGVQKNRLITAFHSEKFFRIIGEGASSTGLKESIVIDESFEPGRSFIRGFGKPKKWGMVNTGDTASLMIPLRPSGERLRLNLFLKPLLNARKGIHFRTCRVIVNNIHSGIIFSDRQGWYSVILPKKAAQNGQLNIRLDFRNTLQEKNVQRAFLFKKITVAAFPGKPLLKERLINNAVLFTIPAGEVEVMEKSGKTIIIPFFKAAGAASVYFKDYHRWRSHTLLISTSDEKLKKEIRKATEK